MLAGKMTVTQHLQQYHLLCMFLVAQCISCETIAEAEKCIKQQRIPDFSGSIQVPAALCTSLHMP